MIVKLFYPDWGKEQEQCLIDWLQAWIDDKLEPGPLRHVIKMEVEPHETIAETTSTRG